MKRILLGLLFLTSPAFAQTITEGGNSYDGVQGALVANNDAVRLNLRGTQWATVKFQATVAGTATATAQITVDGTNYFSSAYAKRLTTVSANPAVQAISATTLTAGDVWEVPLPANATAFQLLAGVGSSTTVKIFGGLLYVPGTPVAATLYDVLSVVNTINATGVLDFSGWNTYYISFSAGGATTVALIGAAVADDGFIVEQTTPAAYTNGNGKTMVAAAVAGTIVASRFGGPTALNTLIPMRRQAFSLAATAAQQTRLRIEVFR